MSAPLARAKKKILDADIDFLVDTLKLHLCDIADITQAKAITGATNATPIVVTANGHGLSNGDFVSQHGVGGNANANGHFKVANVTTNTYELTHPVSGANIAGSGAYTSGGFALGLMVIEFVADIAAGAIVARSAALGSKTTTNGVFDAADTSFSAVTGDQSEVMFLVRDSGSDATSAVIAILDSFTSGMPVTPNGGDINVVFAAAGILAIV